MYRGALGLVSALGFMTRVTANSALECAALSALRAYTRAPQRGR